VLVEDDAALEQPPATLRRMSQLQAQGINSTLQLDSLGMRRFNLSFCCYDFGYRFRGPGFCCFPLCLADTYVRHGLGQFDLGGSEFSQ